MTQNLEARPELSPTDAPHSAVGAAAPSRPVASDEIVGEVAALQGLVARPARTNASQWDAPTKRTAISFLLVAMVGILWVSRPMIPMLVVAGIVAYFLNPIVDFCERLMIPRAVTTIVLYMIVLVGVVLTPVLLVPVLLQQLASLSFDVPTTAFRLLDWLSLSIRNLPDSMVVMGFVVQLDGLTQQVEESFQQLVVMPTVAEILNYFQQLISTATSVVSSTAAIGVSLLGRIVQVIITFLFVFFLSLYMTKDAPRIRAYVEGLVPEWYHSEWVDLLRRMGNIWQAFFRGQIILSLIVGFSTWAALETAGMPGALILGIVAGSLEILPTIGPIIAMIPAVIVAMIQGSTVLGDYGVSNFGFALITVAIYFIIQQVENYVLVPRIIGRGVNLHPIIVLSGVAIGFNVGGILGALFAAPVIASLRVLGGYIHAKLLDYQPFLHQTLPPRREPRPFLYRRTVTGDQLATVVSPEARAAAAAALAEEERAEVVRSAEERDEERDEESVERVSGSVQRVA